MYIHRKPSVILILILYAHISLFKQYSIIKLRILCRCLNTHWVLYDQTSYYYIIRVYTVPYLHVLTIYP